MKNKSNSYAKESEKGSAFIAHVRASDCAEQSLYAHLTGTADIAKTLATKIGLPLSGELIGLVHDLGKYSEAFQTYITELTQPAAYQVRQKPTMSLTSVTWLE